MSHTETPSPDLLNLVSDLEKEFERLRNRIVELEQLLPDAPPRPKSKAKASKKVKPARKVAKKVVKKAAKPAWKPKPAETAKPPVTESDSEPKPAPNVVRAPRRVLGTTLAQLRPRSTES